MVRSPLSGRIYRRSQRRRYLRERDFRHCGVSCVGYRVEAATLLIEGHFRRQIESDEIRRQRRRSVLILLAMAAGAFLLGFVVPVNP